MPLDQLLVACHPVLDAWFGHDQSPPAQNSQSTPTDGTTGSQSLYFRRKSRIPGPVHRRGPARSSRYCRSLTAFVTSNADREAADLQVPAVLRPEVERGTRREARGVALAEPRLVHARGRPALVRIRDRAEPPVAAQPVDPGRHRPLLVPAARDVARRRCRRRGFRPGERPPPGERVARVPGRQLAAADLGGTRRDHDAVRSDLRQRPTSDRAGSRSARAGRDCDLRNHSSRSASPFDSSWSAPTMKWSERCASGNSVRPSSTFSSWTSSVW